MNKLASIDYVASLSLPTIFPRIISSRDEKSIKKEIDSFYRSLEKGWVLRCGEMPDKNAQNEPPLPWDIAISKEELTEKVIRLQKEIGTKYNVFCHEVMPMVRGGVMVDEGSYIIVEAASGSPRELSAMFRGKRNPEEQIVFHPCMLSFKKDGKDILSQQDLYELREMERALPFRELEAVASPFAVEFSWLSTGNFYVHDMRVVN